MWLAANRPAVVPPDALGHFDPLQQSLTSADCLQPTHRPQPVLDGDVRPLDTFGGYAVGAMQASLDMQGTRRMSLERPDIGLVPICDNDHRGHASSPHGLLEESFGAGQVALFTQQHIHDLAMLVDRSVQIPPRTALSG